MSANDNAEYSVDLVFCIDCTGSMRPYLDSVKATANEFHSLLIEKMALKDKQAKQVRVKIIAYRDLGHDGSSAMFETEFYELPRQNAELAEFLNRLKHAGGGDEPESGLEAVALALKSPWSADPDRRSRHVVVVCTDASAHPLGTHEMPGRSDLPRDLDELRDLWGQGQDEGIMDPNAKRMVLFAPDMTPWNQIAEEWEFVIWFPSRAADVLDGSAQDDIFALIVDSF